MTSDLFCLSNVYWLWPIYLWFHECEYILHCMQVRNTSKKRKTKVVLLLGFTASCVSASLLILMQNRCTWRADDIVSSIRLVCFWVDNYLLLLKASELRFQSMLFLFVVILGDCVTYSFLFYCVTHRCLLIFLLTFTEKSGSKSTGWRPTSVQSSTKRWTRS